MATVAIPRRFWPSHSACEIAPSRSPRRRAPIWVKSECSSSPPKRHVGSSRPHSGPLISFNKTIKETAYVFRCTSQEDRAGLGFLALKEEGEVLITDLADLKQSAHGSHIALLDLLGSVHDRGASYPRYSVVVRLTHSSDHGNILLK